ncbi:unnamed protein product [Trichobilharzia szidati]|nr:unnamed protein product [Trichobilharzia szidati]
MIESKVRNVQYIFEFPQITDLFDVSERQGQGTFASVLAVKSKQDTDECKYYALKMIIPTVDIRRIENEVRILRRLGGKHNVIAMHTAMRIRDHVFILMPFVDYIPFTDYYLTADEKEIRRYMRALLSALAHVHKYKIIHRDIKPTNFLMDQKTRQFYLVDFGLAHSEEFGDIDERWERKFEAKRTSDDKRNETKKRVSDSTQSDRSMSSDTTHRSTIANKENNPTHSIATGNSRYSLKCQSQKIDHMPSFKGPTVVKSTQQQASSSSAAVVAAASNTSTTTTTTQTLGQGGCVCGARLTVCRGCRHLPRAPGVRRGGTLGFRPPEVMMRHVEQTTAVDIWAVGVIFLSFLSGRYPFMKVDDDLDVLHAFTHLVGYERMQMGARSIGRRLVLEPRPLPMEASDSPAAWLKTRCTAIRRYEKKFAGLPPLLSKSVSTESITSGGGGDITCPQSNTAEVVQDTPPKNTIALSSTHIFPNSAYDLLARLLEPCPRKRITACDALRHPYFCSTSKSQRHSSIPVKYQNIQQSLLLQRSTSSRLSFCESTKSFVPRPQFC